MVVGDVDDPGAPADRKAAKGDGVAGIELALGKAEALVGIRDRHRQRGCTQKNRVASAAV